MTVTLVYLRVVRRVEPSLPYEESYEMGAKRFRETYLMYKPVVPHELVIVECGSKSKDGFFDGVADRYESYDGLGSDCGTYQFIGRRQESDLVVCFNTLAFFWRDKWLEPMLLAYHKNGPGVYGFSASNQGNPHLRTPAIGFSPFVIRRYPLQINSRTLAMEFESGKGGFALWAHQYGVPSLLVADCGTYRKPEWRTPPNGFRRGTQKDCLVWDRHMLIYQNANEPTKVTLRHQADHG